jgi:hypothetical protein
VYCRSVKKLVEVAVLKAQVSWKLIDLPKTWSVEEERSPAIQFGTIGERF